MREDARRGGGGGEDGGDGSSGGGGGQEAGEKPAEKASVPAAGSPRNIVGVSSWGLTGEMAWPHLLRGPGARGRVPPPPPRAPLHAPPLLSPVTGADEGQFLDVGALGSGSGRPKETVVLKGVVGSGCLRALGWLCQASKPSRIRRSPGSQSSLASYLGRGCSGPRGGGTGHAMVGVRKVWHS